MRTITPEERRARLARRHRLSPQHRAATVVETASSMVCLHGSDPSTVFMSAAVRMNGMKVGDLEQALYVDRSLVKHLAMRRTLFVFPRETLGMAQAGASNRVAQQERRALIRDVEAAGLHPDGERWLSDAGKQVLKALSDGREATSSELRAELPLLEGSIEYGEGKTWGGRFAVGPRVLTVLSAEGKVMRASNDGDWTTSRPRFALTGAWLGEEIRTPTEDEGVAGLVQGWLRAFGPGTEADLKWWLGSTLVAVRRALEAVGAVAVDLDGQVGHVLGDDVELSDETEQWGALLPPLDPTVMGWRDRDWYLGEYQDALFDSAGNAGPTVWWNGRIVGGWRQRDSGEIQLQLLEDVGLKATQTLERESAILEEWLGGRRVLQRFPSPIAKQAD